MPYRILALLALQKHSVALEQIELVHLFLADGYHRVVIVHGLLHKQAVRRRLALEDGRRQIIATSLGQTYVF